MLDNLKNNSLAILFIVLLVGMILRAIMFSGFVGGDDIAYISRAFAISSGDFSAPMTHWGTRTLPVLTTAFSISLFGLNNFSITLFPFLASVFGIYVAFLIGRELFDETTGLLAALLVATFPLEILFATQLFPFAFLSFFSALCFYLFVKGEREESQRLLFYSGLALGLAYTSRITALYCLLFFGLYLLWKRKFQFRYFHFIAGLFLIIFLDMAYYYVTVGDGLHRINVLANQQLSTGTGLKVVKIAGSIDVKTLKWFFEPFYRPIVEQELGFIYLILWPIIIYHLFKRNAAVALLLLWIIPLFLYINYGTTSPFRYYPLRRLPRYLSIISIPVLVLVAYQLKLISIKWRVTFLSLIFMSSALALMLDNSANMVGREKNVYEYINDNPTQNFYVTKKIYFNVKYFAGFKDKKNVKLLFFKEGKPFFISNVEKNITWENTIGCNDYIVAYKSELTQRFPKSHFNIIKTFEWEKNLYQMVKTNTYVLELLAKVRDNPRMITIKSSIENGIVLAEKSCK